MKIKIMFMGLALIILLLIIFPLVSSNIFSINSFGDNNSLITGGSREISANYQFECSDNCVLKTALDANGFNVTINGTGTFELQENIYNWIYLRLMGESATKRCFIHCSGGKCFTR